LSTIRPRVPVGANAGDASRHQPVITPHSQPASSPPPAPEVPRVSEAVEIDRVLDKISATGIASLTPDERRFLDAVASRRRNNPH
jgi:hypothetical protein